MGGRKRHLTYRKYSERKSTGTAASYIVSLPVSHYINAPTSSIDTLHTRITSLPLPPTWIVTNNGTNTPLSICKVHINPEDPQPRASVLVTLTIRADRTWVVSFIHRDISSVNCPLFTGLPRTISSISCITHMLSLINSSQVCLGNGDPSFITEWKNRSLTLHNFTGPTSAFIDDLSLPDPTIRHKNCHFLISASAARRCTPCSRHRPCLIVQRHRAMQASSQSTSPSSRVNYRYQPLPILVSRIRMLKHQERITSMRLERLKRKIQVESEVVGVTVDEQMHRDMIELTSSTDASSFIANLPKDSFQELFWKQQCEAASKKNHRCMRWHPMMIRWCLDLRRRSSGAYEQLYQSGCIRLPSQRTLRDFTYYVSASIGFSYEVDEMLMTAAKVGTCPEREKCVVMLLDEMHIRQDIVFDRHSGQIIGFANLGDINRHLQEFEQSLSSSSTHTPKRAKTMVVFMVRGLFTKLQFPYAQFPAADLTGDLLYDPFWEAVGRVEKCGLKVLASTMDGASINRCLIRMHTRKSEFSHKVENPFSSDKRFLFFFSDPPHLIKTTRNCWESKKRCLWYNNKFILWSHLRDIYKRDTQTDMGLRLMPKIKYEHVSLTSFSRMRVDLAAQALSETVSKALKLLGGDEASETAHFVETFDKFFDALNVHNYEHGVHERKDFQTPYVSAKDKRLKWLENEFLGFLDKWEKSVAERPGEFTRTQRNKMLLSAETRLGLRITCKSFVELVRYLFTIDGVSSFLSQRICQDPLENFFGCQRQRGGVNENPNVQEFIRNTQALRATKMYSVTQGNCRGSKRKKEDIMIDKENSAPLPKRKRQNSKPLGIY